MRRAWIIRGATVAVLLAATTAFAQRGWGRGYGRGEGGIPPRFRQASDADGAFQFCRLMYRQVRSHQRGLGWGTDYPDAEINLNDFLGRTTRIDVADESFRLLELGSPEIFGYPFAYVSEPGEMEMTDAEVENLREYIRRGGFVLIDDFDTWHMDNLREEMSRAFPDKIFERLEPDHPILDVIFTIADLGRMGLHVPGAALAREAAGNGRKSVLSCGYRSIARTRQTRRARSRDLDDRRGA